MMEVAPSPTGVFPINPALNLANLAADGSLTAPPAFYDPVPGDYTYDSSSPALNSYPFYYPQSFLTPGGTCTSHLGASSCKPGFPYIVSADGTTLTLEDGPTDSSLPGVKAATSPSAGTFFAFSSSLVGVSTETGTSCGPGSALLCTTLFSWTWNTTFNGTAGGVSQTRSLDPIDPGSGTSGGVTIVSINGVQLPPVVPPGQISTTASGLAYSRVTRTFNGTVTITNTSGASISGPLQVVFFGLPATVTLVNATNNLSGTPYVTVPASAGIAAGASVTVAVQFSNPSNATINFSPAVYSGSLQ
jgi:hypothetical protein